MVIIRQAVTQEQVAQLRESLEQVFSRTDACVRFCRALLSAAVRSLFRALRLQHIVGGPHRHVVGRGGGERAG